MASLSDVFGKLESGTMVEQDSEDQPMMTEADRGESETPEEEGVAGVLDSEGALEILPMSDGQEETDRAWYVVHCYSGYENKVRHNLEQRIETMWMKDKIFDVVIPTQEEIEVKDGKRRRSEE